MCDKESRFNEVGKPYHTISEKITYFIKSIFCYKEEI
uniref:Uncharacterized protein n=1 Tax=Siphoviridae sp. ctqwY3 TaxID=2827951 RepID=A0A8S5S6N3_9CAUD|nr:MAG TPA: hypothetical protein [Siphoviridae sp. ctqwY3]